MIKNNNQPTFWLEVRKEYIVENFESLLRYLKLYNYKADDGNSDGDFDQSYSCLRQVVEDFLEDISSSNLSSNASTFWKQNETLNLRIIATYLLASDKKTYARS